MPGPTRNRSENLSRERDANRPGRPTLTTGVARAVTWPEPKADWHEIAQMVWDAAQNSGQADFYQQSDVAVLYSLMDDLSWYKRPYTALDDGHEYHKRSGQMLQTIMSALKDLLLTEGDRRRLSLELSAPPDNKPAASVAVMDDYRSGLTAVPDLPKTD